AEFAARPLFICRLTATAIRHSTTRRDEREKALKQLLRRGRAAGDMQVDGHDLAHAADAGGAAGEEAAVASAVAHGDDPLRIRRRSVGALERLPHVAGHGTGD